MSAPHAGISNGSEKPPLAQYVGSTVAVLAAAVLARIVSHFVSLPNLTIIFLLAVLFAAATYGLWPSIYAAVLSALTYNFFFTEPYYTFLIAKPQELLAFIAYFIVAIVAGNLAARVRAQAEAAKLREHRTAALFALSRAVAGTSEVDSVAQTLADRISEMIESPVVVFHATGRDLNSRMSAPAGAELSQSDVAAARWTWENGRQSGLGSDAPGAAWLFIPLSTAEATVGVLGVLFAEGESNVSVSRQRMLEGVADLAAVAIQRAQLATQMQQTRVIAETERLRNALLSSISHDLRTPLASITGSATSLLTYGASYDEPTRVELLQTIQEESDRLNRFVSNLLDITRLESGRLELNRQWVSIEDVIGTAIARLKPALSRHRVQTLIEPDLPLLRLDFVLMEQVLVNLLDNAAKYSSESSTIMLTARRHHDEVVIEVTDEGTGIAAADLERVFDKFYRVRRGDGQAAGTGLGLSICRGLIEAHGGRIVARSRPATQGTIMQITLPIEAQPTAVRMETA
jgi:two-component system sensor histidine kinase KdpD